MVNYDVSYTKASADVLTERQGQVDREGWTPAHDDAHTDGEIAAAAAAYAVGQKSLWPRQFDSSFWKPTNYRRNLVKAGALILAEIERLDRAEAKSLRNVAGRLNKVAARLSKKAKTAGRRSGKDLAPATKEAPRK